MQLQGRQMRASGWVTRQDVDAQQAACRARPDASHQTFVFALQDHAACQPVPSGNCRRTVPLLQCDASAGPPGLPLTCDCGSLGLQARVVRVRAAAETAQATTKTEEFIEVRATANERARPDAGPCRSGPSHARSLRAAWPTTAACRCRWTCPSLWASSSAAVLMAVLTS
jgi:hypothetical protein